MTDTPSVGRPSLRWAATKNGDVDFWSLKLNEQSIGGVQGPTRHNEKHRAFVFLYGKGDERAADRDDLAAAQFFVADSVQKWLTHYGLTT